MQRRKSAEQQNASHPRSEPNVKEDRFEEGLAKNNRAHEEVVAGEPEITGLASDFVAVYLVPPRKTAHQKSPSRTL